MYMWIGQPLQVTMQVMVQVLGEVVRAAVVTKVGVVVVELIEISSIEPITKNTGTLERIVGI